MSQFINTEHANESFRNAIEGYNSDRKRINEIVGKIKKGEDVDPEDILWVCRIAIQGIDSEESSWYDHG